MTEVQFLTRFLVELAKEEDANGSDILRNKLFNMIGQLADHQNDLFLIEDVASGVFSMYFDHHIQAVEKAREEM